MTGIYLIKYPSGRFGFAGRVPGVLAFDSTHPGDLEAARQCGPRIAKMIAEREGRTFNSLSWETSQEAFAFARLHGLEEEIS